MGRYAGEAFAAVAASSEPSASERRRHPRAKIVLGGRYMLSDRREHDCQTVDISSSGVAVVGPAKGAIGERVVAYFDRIGRVEGMVVRHFGECFAVEMRASALRRDRLDLQIEALVKSGIAAH